MSKTENGTIVPSEKTAVYNVNGQEVKLSATIVRNFLTKGDASVTDQDIVQFISVCKYNQLNPFLNEAYLIKFKGSPAQMVVSKEALMKRAEACPNYDGIQSGVIVIRDGKVLELEGNFHCKEDELVGAWAKVYRNDRKYPIVAKVNLSEYDTKRSLWAAKKSTMISKVAKVQALREAFPCQLGAMYISEESSNVEEVSYHEVKESAEEEISNNANSGTINFGDSPAAEEEQAQPNF